MSSDLDKPLCKLVKKDVLKDDYKKYLEIVKNPKYICTKCGRVASKKKFLCKAEKI